MKLWMAWYEVVALLRKACSRKRTFVWLVVVLAAFCIRDELAGVTSFIRTGWIQPSFYPLVLNFFHSKALNVDKITKYWVLLAMNKIFSPVIIGGHRILVADGIKISKEGKKMPAVKSLHNESDNNSKPEYIMGHSFQVISLLVDCGLRKVVAVPLMSRICEGLKFTNRDKRTLLDKLVAMCKQIVEWLPDSNVPLLLVADAYYASHKIMDPLTNTGIHVITRARKNSVAYEKAEKSSTPCRGRPKLYGPKVQLRQLFNDISKFSTIPSPVYGEKDVEIRFLCVDLLWRPIQRAVLFVLVDHPLRGKIILMSTNMQLKPQEIIEAYGLRFKIEVSFKQAVHTLGTYAYHFWMMAMKKTHRGSGNQHVHRESDEYRKAIVRKIDAYHRFVQIGCIAQGLLQHLAIQYKSIVWSEFRSWLRTMNPEYAPSEMVVGMALRSSLPRFMHGMPDDNCLKKFIAEKMQPERVSGFCLAA
jgi:hypothetical protein